jgi:hypothetical protein
LGWSDDGVGLRRQEAEKLMLACNRRALKAAHATPGRTIGISKYFSYVIIKAVFQRAGVSLAALSRQKADCSSSLLLTSEPVLT